MPKATALKNNPPRAREVGQRQRVDSILRQREQLIQEVVRRGPAGLRVHAAPDLHDYLSGAGSRGWRAVAERRAGALVLEVDRALPPGDHRIMELS